MITKRIIPCLDVKDGRVVKGVNFQGLRDISSPLDLAKYYSDNGADELVFYDITASAEGRGIFTDILREAARNVFIPLTVGGGISSVADFERVLGCGADKVSVNTGAIKNPGRIPEAAKPGYEAAVAKKGVLCTACGAEGERCLNCDTVCENCVDVCPNRANVTVRLSDGSVQILHVDKMCNECGNCTAFCPYASEPCKDKLTLFASLEDFRDSKNYGFLFLDDSRVLVRLLDGEKEVPLSDKTALPAAIRELILLVKYRQDYLI